MPFVDLSVAALQLFEMQEESAVLLENCVQVCPVLSEKSEKRKKEKLTAYVQAHKALQKHFWGIDYTAQGRPFCIDEEGKKQQNIALSISHSGPWHALLYFIKKEKENLPLLGVDIEKIDAKIERVAEKFLHTQEAKLLHPETRLLTLALLWASKETLIKMLSAFIVDPWIFKERIWVETIDFQNQKIHIKTNFFHEKIMLDFILLAGQWVLVYGIFFDKNLFFTKSCLSLP